MGKFDGKVAFITGAARGQGRSHAVRLAQEGADIIGVDICRQMEVVGYPMALPDDLAQTVKEVEAAGRRIIARQVDVRDFEALQQAFDEGRAELGPWGSCGPTPVSARGSTTPAYSGIPQPNMA